MGKRALFFVLALAGGIWFIHVGRLNVKARFAQESGKRGVFLLLMGKSRDVTGRMAVLTGWARIVAGGIAIAGGFLYLAFGEFLKK